jgi:hypothetical protein
MRRLRKRDGGSSGGGSELYNLTQPIILNASINATLTAILVQPWYIPLISAGAAVIGGLVTGTFALLGVILSIRYSKRKDDLQTYLDLTTKGGVLIEMYKLLATKRLFAERCASDWN